MQKLPPKVTLTPLMGKLSDKVLETQILLLRRGCEALYTQQELEARLKKAADSSRQLRIKFGMDPTAPDIHLGHTVSLRKVRQFQDLGHKAVLIIGDYTARIGDPSGVNQTRPILSQQQIDANADTYVAQAGKLLDTSSEKLEVRRNSEWLEKLTLMEFIQLAAKKTVAQMLQRDSFKKRLQADQDVFLHEFLYPIIQGYDSLAVNADVELGGTDQTFNNLVGRDIQRAYGKDSQIVIIMPLLVGLDGIEKMSKTKGNYIGVTDAPDDMFGKIMSIPDSLMANYFTLLTELPAERISELVNPDKTHPREAKVALGKLIVETYHDKTAAESAATEFDRVFSQKQTPTDMPEISLRESKMNIVELVFTAGFAKTKSEARRLVTQNAVSIDDQKISDIDTEVELKSGKILRVGKRRFGKITVS